MEVEKNDIGWGSWVQWRDVQFSDLSSDRKNSRKESFLQYRDTTEDV